MTEDLEIRPTGPAQTFALTRPNRGNSLNVSLVEALHRALDGAEAGGVRAVVLRGEGANFCTGFDLTEAASASDGDLLLRFVRIEQLLARIWSARFSVIAIGHGRVTGAGADLFCACEHRVAVEGATFSFPGSGFGLVLGTRRLAQRVGLTTARRLAESGQTIDAVTALDIGLATELVGPDAVAGALDRAIASASRLSYETSEALRLATFDDANDRDLANLVRSAVRPGLTDRIAQYRARTLSQQRTA